MSLQPPPLLGMTKIGPIMWASNSNQTKLEPPSSVWVYSYGRKDSPVPRELEEANLNPWVLSTVARYQVSLRF